MSLELSPFLLDWDGRIESDELRPEGRASTGKPGGQDRSPNQEERQ